MNEIQHGKDISSFKRQLVDENIAQILRNMVPFLSSNGKFIKKITLFADQNNWLVVDSEKRVNINECSHITSQCSYRYLSKCF